MEGPPPRRKRVYSTDPDGLGLLQPAGYQINGNGMGYRCALVALSDPRHCLDRAQRAGLGARATCFFLFQLHTAEARYPVVLPILIAWWWWVGTRIDYGLIGKRVWKHPRVAATLLFLLAVGLFYVALSGTLDAAGWWFRYGDSLLSSQVIILLRTLGPVLWCVVLGCSAVIAGIQLTRSGKHLPSSTN